MATEIIEKPRRAKATRVQRQRTPADKRTSELHELYDWFSPDQLTFKNIDWTVVVWMAGMHIGCLAAPFFFSWQALGLAAVMHWLSSSIGICLGFHRYLSHKSFKLKKPAEFGVMLCSVAAGQGSPLTWAATHRLHHQRSDHEGDPHSPLDGRWWSHILWLFVKHTPEQKERLFQRYVPELVERPLLQFFEKTYGLWLIAMGFAMYAIAGWPGVVWALCVRMVFAYHCTWFVNSATHLWGYRTYETRDESRNLWWVAILAYGEGWHNNHHAHPSTARAGHKWWEIDMTWWSIKALRALGLATDVIDRRPCHETGSASEETLLSA